MFDLYNVTIHFILNVSFFPPLSMSQKNENETNPPMLIIYYEMRAKNDTKSYLQQEKNMFFE